VKGSRLLLAVLVGALAFTAAPAGARDRLDIRLFARVPNPGQPEPIAIGPDGLVYVGTNQLGKGGEASAPSRVFAFSRNGRLVRSYELKGQKLDDDHGIQGLAFDGRGLLYVLDRSADARVVVLDPVSGGQRTYATFRDVPPCSGSQRGDCSATVGDQPAAPDYEAFAPDGTLYVTDIEQALIWRVPPGGGRAEVWFTDPRLENVFGPNGIQLMADGRTLLFAVTATGPVTGDPFSGALYKLPIRPDGRPGELTQFWRSRPFDGPDGFAIARSGNVYLALAGASQIVLLSPRGVELARVPATPADNARQEVPLDGPASAAFLGQRVLVTNQSTAGVSSSWAVLDVFAGEPGLALHRPYGISPGRARKRGRIYLSVRPRRVVAGRRVSFRFRARSGRSRRSRPVRRATIRFAGRRKRTNRRGYARISVRLRRAGRYRAVASKRGMRRGSLRVRAVAPRR
jgi:SMP-30/gluconolaconase/LRE-like protein